MTASNTYLEPYGPKGSFMGEDMGATLSGALNFQKGVDGQLLYANDARQLLVWDNTTFGCWTPAHGTLLLQNPSVWATSVAYVVGNYAMQNGLTYYCATAHTSGTFATDLAAGKWLLANYPRYLFDDFRGTLDARWSADNGGGAAAASPVNTAGDGIGECVLTGGTANGATACSCLAGPLSWLPNFTPPWQAVGATASAGAGTFKQKLTWQAKVKLSNITSISGFWGFVDTLPTSAATSQTPLTLTTATLAVSATNTGVANAVGFLFDSGATTKQVWAVAVNDTVVAVTPVNTALLGPAIAAGIYAHYKVSVDTLGNATFWMAPVPQFGPPVWVQVATIALAVDPTAVLAPTASVASRSGTSPVLTLDAMQAS